MYLGVDVGGTKTLVAVLNDDGIIKQQSRFATPKNYQHFILELRHTVALLTTKDFKAAGIGVPGTIDRKHGIGRWFGNLPWKDVSILAETEKIFDCPTVIENDAKLGALSESMLIKDKYSRVLYVTISTGIGIGLVVDGKIDTSLADAGGARMIVEHDGKHVAWETFASGHAIVERYGKKAADIEDMETWKAIVRDLIPGFLELIALTQPEVIVIGGSVGVYFDRYEHLLKKELDKYKLPMVKMPDLRRAQRPEEAVIFGCYDLAKATYGRAG